MRTVARIMAASRTWWQTPLAVLLAGTLLIAFMFALELLFKLQDAFLGEPGIRWMKAGLIATCAGAGAAYFPHRLLRSANVLVATAVFASLAVLPASFSVVVDALHGAGPSGLWAWLETIALYGGMAIGAAAGGIRANELQRA